MITTAIFDLGEVLLTGLKGAWLKFHHRLEIEPEMARSQIHHPALRELFHGRIAEVEYWNIVRAAYSWNIEVEELMRLVRENFEEVPGTRRIIQVLKSQGFRLGLLSVHTDEWVKDCERRFKFLHLFDTVHFSCARGVCKPDARSFLDILADMRSAPKETLFIDDMRMNTDAAKALGINVIQFVSAEQLVKDFRQFGIYVD